MRKIIIDFRLRNVEKEYLRKYGELIEIKKQDCVYEEISSHPDIFACNINGTMITSPNLNIDNNYFNSVRILGYGQVGKKYPADIKYNVCIIGNYAIHNFKYTDKKIMELIEKNNLKKIQVEQGYSNCSICQISENACITQDIGIYRKLRKVDLDVLLIEQEEICLLNKGISKMKGLIGGATAIIDNKLILFGDRDRLKSKNKIEQFLARHNIEFIDFKGLNIIDYGGIIVLD